MTLTPETEAEIRSSVDDPKQWYVWAGLTGKRARGYVCDLLAALDLAREELQDAEHGLADESNLHALQKNVAAMLRADNQRLREAGDKLAAAVIELTVIELADDDDAVWFGADLAEWERAKAAEGETV